MRAWGGLFMKNIHFFITILATLILIPAVGAEEKPSPEAAIGFVPGSDRQLIEYGQLVGYLNTVAEASPRIEMRQVGSSALGRPMYVAFISSA